MSLLNDLFKGAIVLSILALAEHGFTVKDMAKEAAKVHDKGLTKYARYSRALTGYKRP
tara:strand:+ start:10042 stop:10215 length:174 start_codon:yes stop_codon:yes gene_type:complete